MNLEKNVRVFVRFFGNFQKRGDEVLARAFVVAIAAHVDFVRVVKKPEPALCHQEFQRGA